MLAPLAPDWDHLDAQRKSKWRGIAQRYPDDGAATSSSACSSRCGRGRSSRRSSAQAAREQYKSLRQLPPDKKDEVRQRWEEYQNLPPEQRRELATAARAPPGAGSPAPTPPGDDAAAGARRAGQRVR